MIDQLISSSCKLCQEVSISTVVSVLTSIKRTKGRYTTSFLAEASHNILQSFEDEPTSQMVGWFLPNSGA